VTANLSLVMLHVLLFFILHDYYITSRLGFVTGVIHLGLHCTLLVVVWKVVSRPPGLWNYLYKDCNQGYQISSTNSLLREYLCEKCAKSAISGVIECDRAMIILLLNIH